MISYLRSLFGLDTKEPKREVVDTTAALLTSVGHDLQRVVATIEKLEQNIDNGTQSTFSPYIDDSVLLKLAYSWKKACECFQREPEFFKRNEFYRYRERMVVGLDRMEQAFNYDRSHPQLVALDSMNLTYDNCLQDIKDAESYHIVFKDSAFGPQLEKMMKKQVEHEANQQEQEDHFLSSVDYELQRAGATISKLEQHIDEGTLPSFSPYLDDRILLEQALEMEQKCETMQRHPNRHAFCYQRVVASLDRLEQAFNYDRSHPQLVALDSMNLTYDNCLQDIKDAEELHLNVQDAQAWDLIEEMKKSQIEHISRLNEDESRLQEKDTKEVPREDDSNLCLICLEHERNHALVPCGHLFLCESCAQTLNNQREKAPCPMCRATVSGIFKVYY